MDSTVLELFPDSSPAVNREGRPRRGAVRVPGSPPVIAVDYLDVSFWDRPSADSLRITWGTMLSGYDFRLAVRGDSLTGTYTFRSDVDSFRRVRRGDTTFIEFAEPAVRPAHAVRVACPGA